MKELVFPLYKYDICISLAEALALNGVANKVVSIAGIIKYFLIDFSLLSSFVIDFIYFIIYYFSKRNQLLKYGIIELFCKFMILRV